MVLKSTDMKAQYEPIIYIAVKKVVDFYDTERLLRLGAPGDEYDPISKRIADGIWREHPVSVDELAHMIALNFHFSFRSWGEFIRLHITDFDMAEDIMLDLPQELRRDSDSSRPQKAV
jgi:hypothetical protein